MERGPASDPRHSIRIVCRRTGLSAAVVRAWERRYGAVSPGRSSNRRRLYSDRDVERLVLLRRATLAGRRIGDVASVPQVELAALVEEDERAAAAAPGPGPPAADDVDGAAASVEACLRAVELSDGARLEAALSAASLELCLSDLLERVVGPVLHEVGERWTAGTLDVHHEHLAAAVVRSMLEALRQRSQAGAGPALVVTTPAGERHELGAQMVATLASAAGWGVAYLGPDLPAPEIARAARLAGARAVAVSLVRRDLTERASGELWRLSAELPRAVTLLAGGAGMAGCLSTLDRCGALAPPDLAALRRELDGMCVEPG